MNASIASFVDALPAEHIRRIVRMRFIAIGLMCALVLMARGLLDFPIDLVSVLLLLGGYLLWNGVLRWRAHRAWNGSHTELLGHLLIDCVVLTLVIYYTGGVTNPFATLYLVFVAIGAVVLSRLYAAVILLVVTLGYLMVHFWYVPMVTADNVKRLYQLHLLGMWLSFVMVALMLTLIIGGFAARLREINRKQLFDQQQQQMHDMAFSLGMQAAHVAHDISTPLNSVALLLNELVQTSSVSDQDRELLILAQQQTTVCSDKLAALRARLNDPQTTAPPLSLSEFCQRMVQQWLTLRPEIEVDTIIPDHLATRKVTDDLLVISALQALLDNAAKASLSCGNHRVDVEVDGDDAGCTLNIFDHGPGIASEHIGEYGKTVLPQRGANWGVGLVLSYAAIERVGGSVTLRNNAKGGAIATVHLPWYQEG